MRRSFAFETVTEGSSASQTWFRSQLKHLFVSVLVRMGLGFREQSFRLTSVSHPTNEIQSARFEAEQARTHNSRHMGGF